MRNPVKSRSRAFATLGLATALVSAGLFSMGCDDAQKANRSVEAGLVKANAAHGDAEPKASDDAMKALEEANNTQGASVGYQLNAKVALAQAEAAKAQTMLSELSAKQSEIRRLTWELGQIGSQISSGNTSVGLLSGNKGVEAQLGETIKSIDNQIKEAKGSEDSAWFTHGDAKIPSLAALTSQTASLKSSIKDKSDSIEALKSERKSAIDESEAALAKADTLQGKESLDEFTRGSNARKLASDRATQIEVASAELATMQRDLAMAEAQRAIVEDAVSALEDQKKHVQENLTSVKGQITIHSDLAQKLLDGTPIEAAETGGTATSQPSLKAEVVGVTPKAVILADRLKEEQDLYGKVEPLLSSAVNHFEQAATTASTFAGDLNKIKTAMGSDKSDNMQALDDLRATIDSNVYRLQEAVAQLTLARLYADHAQILNERMTLASNLEPVLELAKLDAPASLKAPSDADLSAAKESAKKAFTAATEGFRTVYESQASPERKETALAARMYAYFSWAEYDRAMGAEEMDVNANMQRATSDRDALKVVPIGLPEGLAIPPAKVTPTSQPATTRPTTPTPSTTTGPANDGGTLMGVEKKEEE